MLPARTHDELHEPRGRSRSRIRRFLGLVVVRPLFLIYMAILLHSSSIDIG